MKIIEGIFALIGLGIFILMLLAMIASLPEDDF
jgi:hypothetical protein